MSSGRVRIGESNIEGRGLLAVVPIHAGEPIFGDAEVNDPSDAVITDQEFRAFIATSDRYSARAIGDASTASAWTPTPLAEARRVLRPGGLLAAAAVIRIAVALDYLRKGRLGDPDVQATAARIVTNGHDDAGLGTGILLLPRRP